MTPDANGCFVSNPYKIDNVIIYKLEIDSNNQLPKTYEDITYDDGQLQSVQKSKIDYCANPSDDNLIKLNKSIEIMSQTAIRNEIYYRGMSTVAIFGAEMNPAWLTGSENDSILVNIDEDADGAPQFGHFELRWEPKAVREGNYIICWTWSPLPAGDKLCAHIYFTLYGNQQMTTSIPTHTTPDNKYEILLETYLPEVFKCTLVNNDLSPVVLDQFNKSIADGFRFLEDIACQTVDLIDANCTHESLLVYLSNLFNLKLKTNDPTLWRGQIKKAVPLFKSKGTLRGLRESLRLANIGLLKFTKLWQIISPYTWQEVINVSDDIATSLQFTLNKLAILPTDEQNFELYLRGEHDSSWTQLTEAYVSLNNTEDGQTIVNWIGGELSSAPITIVIGDSVRILYQTKAIPTPDAQAIENYIRTLSLADDRDERDQECPLKNWNVRLIEEDDPLFDVIITNRHPYHDSLIYGWIRTEFPYSENVYNMEEYNGSTRESPDPCNIDCDFLDPCTYGQSSKYNIDLEIENISDTRMLEAEEVLKEFLPFHSMLHVMNLNGSINDFIPPPLEEIQVLINIGMEDIVVAGEGQLIFNRVIESNALADRSDLATKKDVLTDTYLDPAETVVPTGSAIAYNDYIVIFCPDANLAEIGLDTTNSILEVLAPSSYAGIYAISDPNGNYARVSSGYITESLTGESFTFRLSNEIYTNGSSSIVPEFNFKDASVDFLKLNAKSAWDVLHNPNHIYSGDAWKVSIPAYSATPYVIDRVEADGSVLLLDPSHTLPSSADANISYELLDASDITQINSSTGTWLKNGKSIVTVIDTAPRFDVRKMMKIGNYVLYSGTPYQIVGFVPDESHKLYIEGYTSAGIGGITITVYKRVLDNAIGSFLYQGLKLKTPTNHETGLPILNGSNAAHWPVLPDPGAGTIKATVDNAMKENFLVFVDTDYYTIADIDGDTITLSGPYKSWKTLGSSGTSVLYTILKYEKQSFYLPKRNSSPQIDGHDFGVFHGPEGDKEWKSDMLDRNGKSIIEINTENAISVMSLPFVASALNAVNKNQVVDAVTQKESITYTIEWAEEKEQNAST